MQFQDKEYYGEIWFPENVGKKEFCVLKREEKRIVLTTKLSERNKAYSADLIFGLFTGLGYVTFINNNVVNTISGMITSKSYSPAFCLIGEHFIENPKDFKTFKVNIVNSDLRKWLWLLLFDLYSSDNSISYDENIKESIQISEDFRLSIFTWINHKVSRADHSIELLSKATLKFEFTKEKGILEVIELYKKFQKFLLFFYGSTKQFESFSLSCDSCEGSFEMFYSDGLHKESNNAIINLTYQDLKENIGAILIKWFNDDNILICIDKILNNSLSSKLSYNQKFINAYIALESYLKRFSTSKGKDFKVYLEKNKELILSITGLEQGNLNEYLTKLIRTRDYYVHDNLNQKLFFEGTDLLYEAMMLESLVSILILKELNVQETIIQKVIKASNYNYIQIKQLNIRLSRNILE